MRVLPVGVDAVLVELGSVREAVSLYAAARAARLTVTDIVPGAGTVLFDGVADPVGLSDWLREVDLSSAEPAAAHRPVVHGPVVELPVTYDGPDLDEVARQWDMTTREVVTTHTSTRFVVAFCGFVPGFAYCTGLPAELTVTRHSTPRPRVPAGSVGVAGAFTGIYPTASPGGWQLLGRTDVRLWDPDADQPARLTPGTEVLFLVAAP